METDTRDTENVKVTLGYFPPPETLFFFGKSLVLMLPCWRITLFLTTRIILGLFYCMHPLLTRGQIVCIISHLLPLYLGFELNNYVFLNKTKPFAEIASFFEEFVQWVDTYHQSYIICIANHFLWVQSNISIIYHHWLCWKFVLDFNLLRFSHFVKVLLPYLL